MVTIKWHNGGHKFRSGSEETSTAKSNRPNRQAPSLRQPSGGDIHTLNLPQCLMRGSGTLLQRK